MRLLLIDDSSAYHEEFAQILEQSDLPVAHLDVASSADEGARLLRAGLHDAYVVDFRLPGGDGLTLIAQARSAGVTKPIILLTGFDSPAVDRAAERAGANDYLAKGLFSPEDLARSLRYATSNAAAIRRATEAENRFRMAQEAAGIGTWSWDLGADLFTWSAIQHRLFGLDPHPREGIRFATWHALVHPDDRLDVEAAVKAARDGGASLDVTFRILRPNLDSQGRKPLLRWISMQGQVQTVDDGSPPRLIGVGFDVTERQNALLALRAGRDRALTGMRMSEARFRTYFESAVDCQFHVVRGEDGQFRYENVNPAGLAHSGLPLSAMIDRTPEEVLGPEVGRVMTERLRRVAETGETVSFEATLDMGSGAVVYDAIYMPLWDETGTLVGILGSARDITERRRLEQATQMSQRMETLGQLAGGVAHDFNNLLQDLTSCLDALQAEGLPSSGRDLVREGKETIKRGASLTGRLLAFSRQQVMTTEAMDLNGVILAMTDVLARTLDGRTRVRQQLAEDLWPVAADRSQIELALLNLGINARDAMPEGGSLTVSTRNEIVVGPQPDELAPGSYVAVAVSDTGTGMTPDVLARALEPFFTTKEVGKGTGLGLSMVYGTVKQLGGGIRIASEIGTGTCVTLYLPRLAAEAGAAERPVAAQLRQGDPASLLLVDDDAATQEAVRRFAEELGHRVVVAVNGTEAIQLLEAGQPVDAAVVAARLSGLSGARLITLLHRARPHLPSLLLTEQPDPSWSDTGFAALAKPLTRQTFAAALGTLLERSPPPPQARAPGRRRGRAAQAAEPPLGSETRTTH